MLGILRVLCWNKQKGRRILTFQNKVNYDECFQRLTKSVDLSNLPLTDILGWWVHQAFPLFLGFAHFLPTQRLFILWWLFDTMTGRRSTNLPNQKKKKKCWSKVKVENQIEQKADKKATEKKDESRNRRKRKLNFEMQVIAKIDLERKEQKKKKRKTEFGNLNWSNPIRPRRRPKSKQAALKRSGKKLTKFCFFTLGPDTKCTHAKKGRCLVANRTRSFVTRPGAVCALNIERRRKKDQFANCCVFSSNQSG